MNFTEQQSYSSFPSLCTLDSAMIAGMVLGGSALIGAVIAISRWCYFSPEAPTGEDDMVGILPQEVQRAIPAPIPAQSEHRAISRFYAENP